MITKVIRDWSCSGAHQGHIGDIRQMINENENMYRGKLEAYERAISTFGIHTADPTKADPVIRDVLIEGKDSARDYVSEFEKAKKQLDNTDQPDRDKSILFLEICWEHRKVRWIDSHDVAEAISQFVTGFSFEQVFSGVPHDEEIPTFEEEDDYSVSHVYLFCKDNREAVAIKLAI